MCAPHRHGSGCFLHRLIVDAANLSSRSNQLCLGSRAVCPCDQGAHVFLKVGLLVAERLLYIPSSGVCMLCGWILASSAASDQRAAVALLLTAMVVACAWRSQTRNVDWTDADSLYAAALEVCPESARINNNIGTRCEKPTRCIYP